MKRVVLRGPYVGSHLLQSITRAIQTISGSAFHQKSGLDRLTAIIMFRACILLGLEFLEKIARSFMLRLSAGQSGPTAGCFLAAGEFSY